MSAATSPVKASGTTLGYKVGSASVYTALTQLIETTEPTQQVGKIDTTTLSAAIKSSIPSIPDPGEVTFSVYAVNTDTTVQELHTLIATPQVVAWQLQAADGSSSTTGSTCAFSGYLTKYEPKGYKVDGTPVADVTIQVTGSVTYTPGT